METQKTYWKSFEELAQDPSDAEALKNEFSISRRSFLSLLGASVALATTACRRPVHKIIPYVKQPENVKAGIPLYYASTFSLNNHSYGVLVKTREGRPIKIEGNTLHPLSLGSTNVFSQASILELYDPDRKKYPTIAQQKVGWGEWQTVTGTILKNAKIEGKRVAILTESTTSKTLRNLLDRFAKEFPNAHWFEFEAASQEGIRDAYQKSFGSPEIPKTYLHKAETILSLNSDFIGTQLDNVIHIKNWSKNRKVKRPGDRMNRLYVVESSFSLTGSNADHRLPLKPSEMLLFSLNLAKHLVFNFHLSEDSELKTLLGKVPGSFQHSQALFPEEFLKVLAEDLVKNRGKSVVLIGEQEQEDLHIVGNLLNTLLGSFGNTIETQVNIASFKNGFKSIAPLLEDLQKGKVDVLITIGGNPSYYLGKEFSELLSKVKNSIRLSLYDDETAEDSQYTAPLSHFLESWGDSFSETGVASLSQPLIRPLHNSKSAGEVLLAWSHHMSGKEGDSSHDWLNEIKGQWQRMGLPWEKTLHDGIATLPQGQKRYFAFRNSALVEPLKKSSLKQKNNQDTLELHIQVSPVVYDGRFANNSWLQELPHPVTKITWDNVASMSPETAQKHHLKSGDKIEISFSNEKVVLPVFLQPGLVENVITTEIGYGRTKAGEVGNAVGGNVLPLLLAKEFTWQLDQVTIEKKGENHPIATTQAHHSLDGRSIVHEATLEEYEKHPNFPRRNEHTELIALYPNEHEYNGHKWGMVIDLNSCVGCNACVIACDSENNIAVVGKEQVLKGREMHWMRIDRYYENSNQYSPKAIHQPMLCQHCENAPCENVCPVAATTHSPEGLNEMTYNRCVGTRYCSNNCPYKVRRFNYFDFTEGIKSPEELASNPDVTVRMRGVMEKCTFCVQRINAGKFEAKEAGFERVPDGKIKTACQESCPAEAIVFGDLNNPDSAVSKESHLSHGFHVLKDFNTKPSITYLAKIRNPHPKLLVFEHNQEVSHS